MKTINHPKWAKVLGLMSASLIVLVVHTDVLAAEQQGPLKPKRVTSFKQLKQMLSAKTVHAHHALALRTMTAADTGGVFTAAEASGAIGHSETNVQVEGVDEGDVVKTDGQYLYRIQNGQVRIVRAYPADNMALVASLQFDTTFSPVELYLHGDQLIVVGTGWQEESGNGAVPATPGNGLAKIAIWAPSGESRTIARVYDITDRANPSMQREIAFSGDYLSSRRIGDSVYLIGRKYPRYFLNYFVDADIRSGQLKMTRDNILPHISDSAVASGEEHPLPLTDLYYFPNFVEPDYVVVAGFRLNALAEEADIKAYLGGGEITYASSKNLYLSAADYSGDTATDPSVTAPVTHLYKFALNNGGINFRMGGEVPGTVLNSFSMDEHNNYFRIATTVDQWMQTGDTGSVQTWNNLYTLDADMKIAGRLEHLAEGERIYSARFIGERSYLVTFRQTDPLFVIDLSTPEAPKVLGELKIPGFSNYLHPYDENHILGFGQDTEETDTGVVTKGMKLALFDVSDVEKPVQMHSLTIGEQGTYSPLMYDHKALLFDKTRGLLGFPISETAQKPGEDWPTEVFQGAHLYTISLADGFQKQAAISHQGDGELYDWNHYIQRLLTIGDQLYTLSETRLQANDLAEFKLTGVLDFPVAVAPDCPLAEETVSGAAIAVDCPVLIDPINQPTVNNIGE
ncbi:MAG: hypothetical protein EPN89_17285 [Methylovulum sp.]|nr:MAG: hypothetical protein EPN89_17285 [Methylovulum sp.]